MLSEEGTVPVLLLPALHPLQYSPLSDEPLAKTDRLAYMLWLLETL